MPRREAEEDQLTTQPWAGCRSAQGTNLEEQIAVGASMLIATIAFPTERAEPPNFDRGRQLPKQIEDLSLFSFRRPQIELEELLTSLNGGFVLLCVAGWIDPDEHEPERGTRPTPYAGRPAPHPPDDVPVSQCRPEAAQALADPMLTRGQQFSKIRKSARIPSRRSH